MTILKGENMKVIKTTKEYFETEEDKVYFFEPLGKEISIEDMQKIVDVNEKLIRGLEDGKNIMLVDRQG